MSHECFMQKGKREKGKKRIADDMIEIIEAAFKLPRGWLDQESGSPGQKKQDTKIESTHDDENIQAAITLMESINTHGRAEIRGKIELWITEILKRNNHVQLEEMETRITNFDR